MVAGLPGNESSDSNRFILVTPKSENDVRLQATLGNQNPMGLPMGVVRALKSAYNYVRENIDSNFDKYVADNVSYGYEENIEDIKRWISEEGEDAQVALYYAQHEGAYVFNDFDIYVEGMDFTNDNYLITTLKKALAVLELQDEMFDNVTN